MNCIAHLSSSHCTSCSHCQWTKSMEFFFDLDCLRKCPCTMTSVNNPGDNPGDANSGDARAQILFCRKLVYNSYLTWEAQFAFGSRYRLKEDSTEVRYVQIAHRMCHSNVRTSGLVHIIGRVPGTVLLRRSVNERDRGAMHQQRTDACLLVAWVL